jgi:hypothetical protein
VFLEALGEVESCLVDSAADLEVEVVLKEGGGVGAAYCLRVGLAWPDQTENHWMQEALYHSPLASPQASAAPEGQRHLVFEG